MATRRRYNAAIQRVKGMIELASGPYETSLSHQTRRAAEGVLQGKIIPTDNSKPLDIAQLCANDGEAPDDVPLHPGARRFYRERGYLE